MAHAMTMEDYKAIRDNVYTLVVFDRDGNRVQTLEGFPMHVIMSNATACSNRGLLVKIFTQDDTRDLSTLWNRIEDYDGKA
jgi:hypothetical protein